MKTKIAVIASCILLVLIIVSCEKQSLTGNTVVITDIHQTVMLKPVSEKPVQKSFKNFEGATSPRYITLLKEAFSSGQEMSCSFVLPSNYRNEEGHLIIKGNKFVVDLLGRRDATTTIFDGSTYFIYEKDEDEGWQFKESEIALFKKYHSDIDFLSREELIEKATGAKCSPDKFSDADFRRPTRIEFGDVVTELVRDGIYPN